MEKLSQKTSYSSNNIFHKITSNFLWNVDIQRVMSKVQFKKCSQYLQCNQKNKIYENMISKNVIFLNIRFFKKWSKQNILFIEMLIFSELWANLEKKIISEKGPLSRNVDIHRVMRKIRFMKNDLKKVLFLKMIYFQKINLLK